MIDYIDEKEKLKKKSWIENDKDIKKHAPALPRNILRYQALYPPPPNVICV